MKSFYLCIPPESLSERKRVEWSNDVHFESVMCPKFPEHQHTTGRRETRHLRLKMPNNTDDIIWTWYSDLLVTQKVLDVLRINNATGFEIRDIYFEYDKRDFTKKDKLYELFVTGSGGHIHPLSGYQLIDKCRYCGAIDYHHAKNGLMVNEEVWDGSDIFTLNEYPKMILVTQRVKDLVQKHRFKSIQFVPAVEYKITD